METKNENQLALIVEQSGLEQTKAQYILENFSSYFALASEWEKRAKDIIVTDESQTADMAIARVGRLALREKRITLEKERKRLKEQALREGKAIDGIANVLKAVIQPIEEYLDKQENFVKYKKQEEERIARLEAEKKELERLEAERIAKEKAEAEERERMIKENERLKKEAEENQKELDRQKAEAEAKKRAIEAQAREERERAESERIKQQEIIDRQKAEAEAERKKHEEAMKKLIECPKCGHKF